MKRLLALLLSLALTLCGAAAWAEEETSFTLTNDMVVDLDALWNAADRLGFEDMLLLKIVKRAALLDALELKLCGDQSSIQFDAAFNGSTALTFGARHTENGYDIVSTLFPTYTITLTPDKLMGNLIKLFEVLDHANKSIISLPGKDGTPAEPSLAGDLVDYLSENLPPFAEAEKGNFELNGVKYDSKQELFIGHETLVSGWQALVDLFFSSEQTAPLVEDAKKSGLELTPENLKALLPAESLPAFSITIYRSSASSAVDYSATALSADGTKRYAELHTQATDTTEDVTLRSDLINAEVPLLHMVLDLSDEELHTTAELPAFQATADLHVEQQDGEWRLTARVFSTDAADPFFQETLLYQPSGKCTLDFDDASRTPVPLTRLVQGEDGYQTGFLTDVLLNGLTRFTNALAAGVPKLEKAGSLSAQSEEKK